MGPLMYGSPDVYPACAGIHLNMKKIEVIVFGLPRMRGDPPLSTVKITTPEGSTPHARGSTLQKVSKPEKGQVYPACAGIHPLRIKTRKEWGRLPRMRGDLPLDGQV